MRRKLWPIRTSVCLSEEVYELIKSLSRQKDASVSDLIRKAVDQVLLENDMKPNIFSDKNLIGGRNESN